MKARVNDKKAADGITDATDHGLTIGDTVEIVGFVHRSGSLIAICVHPELPGFGEVLAWMLDPLIEVTA